MSDVGVVTVVRFKSRLDEDELLRIATERSEEFRGIPGLLQKLYFGDVSGDGYGAVYLWDSPESVARFRESELFASIPGAYEIEGPMEVTVGRVVHTLR